MSENNLTHLDDSGQANMVDVSGKASTTRMAKARGRVSMKRETFTMVLEGNAKKGDVISAARLAGIMAAKRTHELIPLCHPLMLSKVSVELVPDPATCSFFITATAKVTGQTGVEMEALTAVSVACLTIYDMVKAVDRGVTITDIRLLEKSGGKSGHYKG